jgi:predicted O-methyltransferase YrrM
VSIAGRARTHVIRAGRAALHDVLRPPYTPPGHFYSPISASSDRERAIADRRPPSVVDLREEEQLRLIRQLDLSTPPVGRWEPNTMFGSVDAAYLRAMLLHHRPKRYVEIGSGYSTAIALDVADQHLPGLQITCVEPYADRLRSRLRPGDAARLTLLEQPVQDVSISRLVEGLEVDDVFFIDSTHVVKAGSDVLKLLLRILPELPPGVLIHIHDIHWPFEYPDSWLREGRDWTEAYFVHAFLAYNDRFPIVLFGDWVGKEHPAAIPATHRGAPSGSLWLRKL